MESNLSLVMMDGTLAKQAAASSLAQTKVSSPGVNSKKPPHYRAKFEKQPIFFEIAKNHRYCVGCLQCSLIVIFSRVNTESDNGTRLLVMTWQRRARIYLFWAFL
jgi:hypothetical protein